MFDQFVSGGIELLLPLVDLPHVTASLELVFLCELQAITKRQTKLKKCFKERIVHAYLALILAETLYFLIQCIDLELLLLVLLDLTLEALLQLLFVANESIS